MNELPPQIKKRIDRFLPVEKEGITLYPILVDKMEEFTRCRAALEFLHQSLPVAMIQIPLLSAFFQLEIAASAMEQESGETIKITLFSDAVYLLTLSLRLGLDMDRDRVLGERVLVVTDRENPTVLTEVDFITDKGEIIKITPGQFGRFKPIIAAQNGVELQPEDANPELVEAERAILAARAPKLNIDPAVRVSWVAAHSHADEETIYSWPILKFERRCEVLKRTLDYLIYGIGQASGMVTFKDGNPVPSPFFGKVQDSVAMRPLSDLANPGAEHSVRDGFSEQANKGAVRPK